MEPKLRKALTDALSRALEEMAFMFAEPAEKDKVAPGGPPYVVARMEFAGPVKGVFSLVVPVSMCAGIAANMLGMERTEKAVADKGIDALKEILNIACGQFVTAYGGEEPVFELAVPEAADLSPEEWTETLNDEETVAFLVDDVPILAAVRLTGGGKSAP